MLKRAILALVSVFFAAAMPVVATGQIDPKSPEYKMLEKNVEKRTEKVAKEQKMYDELFGDCDQFLREAVLNTNKANETGLLGAYRLGSAVQALSIRGLLNLEIYKLCRELKSGR